MPSISNLFAQLQQVSSEFIHDYCVVNRAIMPLKDVEKMGRDEFSLKAKLNMPLKLYKYFPNTMKEEKNDDGQIVLKNYSLEALESNTVFLSSPDQFDDVYDSDIYVSWPEYAFAMLKQYAQWCDCSVDECKDADAVSKLLWNKLSIAISNGKRVESAFALAAKQEKEALHIKLLCAEIEIGLASGYSLSTAIVLAIQKLYGYFIDTIRNIFRVACFTTSPFSQLMWGAAYANNHRGFCIEYTINPSNLAYRQVYYNLFPVIYCNTRKKVTEELLQFQFNDITVAGHWDVYFNGALRKSFDWAYQNEWRLLLPGSTDGKYVVNFFKITKVYLGNRMPQKQRREIIEFCHKSRIPYIGIIRAGDHFEMQECNMLCEDCPRLGNAGEEREYSGGC